MKYIVIVADKSFEVEIEDIYARPVIARVDGKKFEVSPQDGSQQVSKIAQKEFKPLEVSKQPSNSSVAINELIAPLPGTVIEVFVKLGDSIEAGQVILVIEAMKMKNSIRSTRAGKITDVLVSAGQTVAHKQALVRFAE
jgi:glutaconyl-CoA/methylmalonyl-CoA decarboxylase subunit gamma